MLSQQTDFIDDIFNPERLIATDKVKEFFGRVVGNISKKYYELSLYMFICIFVKSKFKDKIAINNLSLTIFEGDCIGLIGPNGAGKSSLINELRKNSIDEMYVLPAQKLLYFVSNISNRNNIEQENYIRDLKNTNIKYDTIDLYPLNIQDNFSNTFTKLITFLIKDYDRIIMLEER